MLVLGWMHRGSRDLEILREDRVEEVAGEPWAMR